MGGDGDVIFDRVADLTDGPAVLAHVARTDNPHATTAAQVGAYTTAAADTLLAAKAPLASPALTGTPTAPTAASATNTTQLATTAFVQAVIALLVNSSPSTLDTLKELADALGDDPNFATTIATLIGTVNTALTTHSALTTTAHGGIVALSGNQTVDDQKTFTGLATFTNDVAFGGLLYESSASNWQIYPDGSAYFGSTLSGQYWSLDTYGNFTGSANYANEAGYADNFYGSIDGSQIGSGTVGTAYLPTIPVTLGGTNLTTYALGDTLYASAANTLAKLAGNTTTTKKLLAQTGNGTVSAAPAWQDADTAGLVAKSGTQTGIAGDKTWTGFHTFSGGLDAPGSGVGSTKIGTGANASGQQALAFGPYSAATGYQAVAFGSSVTAGGSSAFGLGSYPCSAPFNSSGALGGGITTQTGELAWGTGFYDPSFCFQRYDSTDITSLASIGASWSDSTHATRKGRLKLGTYSTTTLVVGLQLDNDGTNNLIAVGGGTQFKKILSATATLDFGSIAAGAVADLTMTVTGAATGDSVSLGVPTASIIDNVSYTAWVSAADTVTVRASNDSLITARDPASGSFRATVMHF